MARPGFERKETQYDLCRHFSGRADEIARFRSLLNTPAPPVLAFHGVGGIGKTWLLHRLRQIAIEGDRQTAYINLDRTLQGEAYLDDPNYALFALREQIGGDTPRFDLAYAIFRYKRGDRDRPELKGEGLVAKSFELAAKIAETAGISGASLGEVIIKQAVHKLRNTAFYHWLLTRAGFCDDFVRVMQLDPEQIAPELMKRLAEDWRAMTTGETSISPDGRPHAVVFVDSTEWIEVGYTASTHADLAGRWLRDLCIEADSVLFVLAGQNGLNWERIDSNWKTQLKQQNLEGFSEVDARAYLTRRGIAAPAWVAAMLAVSAEAGGRYHALSLAWAADVGTGGNPAEFTLSGDRWNWLRVQFLKSLRTDGERNAIKQLAVPPRFDRAAIRWVYGEERLERAAEERLCTYSFVEPLSLAPGGSWWRMRPQLRRSVAQGADKASLPSASRKWNDYWVNRGTAAKSEEMALDFQGLAWALRWELDSASAFAEWVQHVSHLRTELNMSAQYAVLNWWTNTDLESRNPLTQIEAHALDSLGNELREATMGDIAANLRRAIRCHHAALSLLSETRTPDWARTQNNLGNAYVSVPDGDRLTNLRQAIECFENALKVYRERDFPVEWARAQGNLGNAYRHLPDKDRGWHIQQAISHYEAALRVWRQDSFPVEWAGTQSNLGNAYMHLQDGNRSENLRKAIACHKRSLSVRTKARYPSDRAATLCNLGSAYAGLLDGDRTSNLRRAIKCFEAALKVFKEKRFPRRWAATKTNLGNALVDLPDGDRAKQFDDAIACFQAALQVETEDGLPEEWAKTQVSLARAYWVKAQLQTAPRQTLLQQGLEHIDNALRVFAQEAYAIQRQGALEFRQSILSDLPKPS